MFPSGFQAPSRDAGIFDESIGGVVAEDARLRL